MKRHYKTMILGLAALTAANLLGCVKEPEYNTGFNESQQTTDRMPWQDENGKDLVKDNRLHEDARDKFVKRYGDISPQQGWIHADVFDVVVKLPERGHRVGVYAKVCSRWYLLSQVAEAEAEQAITVSCPKDVIDVYVVVDHHYVYNCPPTAMVNVSTDAVNTAVTADWASVPYLSWVIACESPTSLDYDFNDLVARVTPQADGSLLVQALAAGLRQQMWLHYTNGENDYVLSPAPEDEGYRNTAHVDDNVAPKLEWHRWFDDAYSYGTSNMTINTLCITDMNFRTGATALLEAEAVGPNFTPGFMARSAIKQPNGLSQYAMPLTGFYVTRGTYSLQKLPKEGQPYTALISLWPAGYPAQMIVIPDACGDDTAESYRGWCWPSEISPIDWTYRGFKDWVGEPTTPWYTAVPDGWSDREARLAPDGEPLIWGYYPR